MPWSPKTPTQDTQRSSKNGSPILNRIQDLSRALFGATQSTSIEELPSTAYIHDTDTCECVFSSDKDRAIHDYTVEVASRLKADLSSWPNVLRGTLPNLWRLYYYITDKVSDSEFDPGQLSNDDRFHILFALTEKDEGKSVYTCPEKINAQQMYMSSLNLLGYSATTLRNTMLIERSLQRLRGSLNPTEHSDVINLINDRLEKVREELKNPGGREIQMSELDDTLSDITKRYPGVEEHIGEFWRKWQV